MASCTKISLKYHAFKFVLSRFYIFKPLISTPPEKHSAKHHFNRFYRHISPIPHKRRAHPKRMLPAHFLRFFRSLPRESCLKVAEKLLESCQSCRPPRKSCSKVAGKLPESCSKLLKSCWHSRKSRWPLPKSCRKVANLFSKVAHSFLSLPFCASLKPQIKIIKKVATAPTITPTQKSDINIFNFPHLLPEWLPEC